MPQLPLSIRLLMVCSCAWICSGGAGRALAQTPAPATPAPAPTTPAPPPGAGAAGTESIPDSVKTTPNPAIIGPFIKAQVAKLAGDDAEQRRVGRQNLVTEASSGTVTPAPLFLTMYATMLNDALPPVINGNNVAARLNAAIAVARVAEKTGSAAMAPTVLQLLTDKSEAVRLWALRAAKYVLPQVLMPAGPNAGPNGAKPNDGAKMIDAIITAGQSMPNGTLIADMYEALSLDCTNSSKYPPGAFKAMVATVLPRMIDVATQRANLFKNGVPPQPTAEKPALNIMTVSNVWREETPQMQLQVVQLLSDVVSMAGHRATVMQPQQPERAPVLDLVQFTARIIYVAGTNVGNEDVKSASRDAQAAGVNMPNDKILAAVDKIYPALVKVKGWEKLTQPPAINEAAAPAPAPASGAATAPAGGARPATAPKPPGT